MKTKSELLFRSWPIRSQRTGKSNSRLTAKRPCSKCCRSCASTPSRDFSYYKRPDRACGAFMRRMTGQRRRRLFRLPRLPAEASWRDQCALLQDLLISVTNFFRDCASFEALEEMIPKLFDKKGAG